MTTLITDANTLEEIEHATSIKPHQRQALQRVVGLLRGQAYLRTGDVRERLGIGSINTVKRLAEDGFLPGAYRNERGVWQIPLSSVVRLEEQREQAHRDSLSPSKGIRVSNKSSHRLTTGVKDASI